MVVGANGVGAEWVMLGMMAIGVPMPALSKIVEQYGILKPRKGWRMGGAPWRVLPPHQVDCIHRNPSFALSSASTLIAKTVHYAGLVRLGRPETHLRRDLIKPQFEPTWANGLLYGL